MNQATLDFLKAADTSEYWEAPEGFDNEGEMANVARLQSLLEAIIGRALLLDDQVQDASYFTELYIRQAEIDPVKGILTVIGIRFSGFNRMFTVWSNSTTDELS